MHSAAVDMPSRIRALPRDRHGRPIPWFVAVLRGGERDFRIAGGDRRTTALRQRLCWVCGQPLPRQRPAVFTLGPMCVINRITGEPPAHDVCATYSAQACPFLAVPQMTRRTRGLPDDEPLAAPPGLHAEGNPGGAILWHTPTWTVTRVPFGGPGNPGVLIRIGPPTAVTWWSAGQQIGRAEAETFLRAGLANLRDAAGRDPDPVLAQQTLDRQYATARLLLPRPDRAGAVR